MTGQVETPPMTFLKEDTGTYTYMGEAVPGTATSASKWSVSRKTNSTGSIYYAGSGSFVSIWDNRATLTYA